MANLSNDITVAIGSQAFDDDNNEDSENTSLMNSHRRSRS